MSTNKSTSERWCQRALIVLQLLLIASLGCSHDRYTRRIVTRADGALPQVNHNPREEFTSLDPTTQEVVGVSHMELAEQESSEIANSDVPTLSQATELSLEPSAQSMTLPVAISTAFQTQPRLRVYLESIEQARGGEDIAFAPFLPMAMAGYSAGGFNLNAGGNSPNFNFIPGLGSIPFGLNINTGYEFADLKLQWLICDFGRRVARYRQAGIAVEIAQLQTERAYQTVANEVSIAYYQVLRSRALRKTAIDAVRRAEEDLDVAKKLALGGALEREKVLRVEVQLAEAQRFLDNIESAESVAIAALNLAIGWDVNTPTSVQENSAIPEFTLSLAECLQTAAGTRREFQVARQAIQSADESRRVAKADFAPKIIANGALIDFQQAAPRGHADLAAGSINLEWGLFEGGKRVAELRVADSKIRAAMAQAESIADTVAFQVNETYRQMITAQRGIIRSQPAVAQAEENYRLVQARAKEGDATSAEITDAESTFTRAQQDHLNSIHDYLIALARLEYAMGTTPTPASYCPEESREWQ